MKLAVMTYSYSPAIRSGQTTLVDAMRFTREQGVKGIDFLESLYEGPAAEMKRIMEDLDVEPAIYTVTGQDFCHADASERQPAVERVLPALDRALEMGFGRMMVTTGSAKEGMQRQDAARYVGEGLRPCLEHATELGLELTIEDFPGPLSPHATSAECLAVCETAGPEMRLTFDSGNCLSWGEDPVAFWQATHHLVVHCHAKDWVRPEPGEEGTADEGRKFQGELVGQGMVDYPPLLAAMKASGYDGYIAFEYEGKEDRMESARRGLAYLRETIAGLS